MFNVNKHLETPWLPACWMAVSSSLSYSSYLRQRLSRTGHRWLFQRGFLGRLLGRLLGRPWWNRGILEFSMIEMTRQTRNDSTDSTKTSLYEVAELASYGLCRLFYELHKLHTLEAFFPCVVSNDVGWWVQVNSGVSGVLTLCLKMPEPRQASDLSHEKVLPSLTESLPQTSLTEILKYQLLRTTPCPVACYRSFLGKNNEPGQYKIFGRTKSQTLGLHPWRISKTSC